MGSFLGWSYLSATEEKFAACGLWNLIKPFIINIIQTYRKLDNNTLNVYNYLSFSGNNSDGAQILHREERFR